MNYLQDFLSNTALITAIVSWAVAQVLKVFTSMIVTKKFDIWQIFAAGGMPSSHSALMAGLCFTIFEQSGLASTAFAIAFCVLSLTMYDAAGVRREAGRHARFINMLVDQWEREHGEIADKNLKEIIGHTPLEVFGGVIVGVIVAMII